MDPNRVEGKRLTTVDVGDVMQLKSKKEQGTYKGKVLSVTSYTNVTQYSSRGYVLVFAVDSAKAL